LAATAAVRIYASPPSRFFFETTGGERRWVPALRWDHDLPETQLE